MSDLAALVAGIRADRDNHLRRLVTADWFEENGQPERGEFIRLSVAVAGELKACRGTPTSAPPVPACGCEACAAARRLRDLTDVYVPQWEHDLREPGRAKWAKRHLSPPADSRPRFHWALGFVVAVRCRLDWWLEWGPLLSLSHPVRRIEARDLNPQCRIAPPERRSPRVARYSWGAPPAGPPTAYTADSPPAILWHSRHLIVWQPADPDVADSRPGAASRHWPTRRRAMQALSRSAVEWTALAAGVTPEPAEGDG